MFPCTTLVLFLCVCVVNFCHRLRSNFVYQTSIQSIFSHANAFIVRVTTYTLHKTLLKHITLNKVHLKRISRYARCHNCHIFVVRSRAMYAFSNERKFIFSLLSISAFEFGIFSHTLLTRLLCQRFLLSLVELVSRITHSTIPSNCWMVYHSVAIQNLQAFLFIC